MKAFLAMLMVLWFAVAVYAQPQAPVVWGEARWAHLAGWPGLPQIVTLRVIPMGDTLLFTALNVGSEVSDTILVCSSLDNGQTFTPWVHVTNGENSVSANFAGSAGYYYCFVSRIEPGPDAIWVLTSSDGGLTWGSPQQYRTNATIFGGFASGSEVLAKYLDVTNNDGSTRVIRSVNYGQSWSTPTVIDTADFYLQYFGQSIAFTRTHKLIIEEPVPSRHDPRLYVATGDSSGQNWTTFQAPPCAYNDQLALQNKAAIVADSFSEAAGVLGILGLGNFTPDRPIFFRSTDGGMTWEDCIALTDEAHVIPWFLSTSVPLNICHGKLWMLGWEHLSPNWGNFVMTRFSANHGRNWYPLQVAADSVRQLIFLSGQFRDNQVHVYWCQGIAAADPPWDFRMVSGTITPDTTLPMLQPLTAIAETVSVRQQLLFGVSATDNDTLSEVRLVMVTLSGDTLRAGMVRVTDSLYYITWVVPDSGYYSYWFEAEDFWENIATLPDSGTFHFVTEGWSASEEFIPHPSSFILSVFPNPFNSTTQIEFTLPFTQRVSLRICDVLGREVAVLVNEIQAAGRHEMTFDASGLPSGTYLCRLEAGGMAQTKKIVLVK